MKIIRKNDLIFAITLDDIQSEAQEYIGRELTDQEILIAKKRLEWGLLTDIENVYKTIFLDMEKK